jgi:hypothetical protein
MKLYAYSVELSTFVEAKWAIVKFTIVGVILVLVIAFGIMKLNQPPALVYERVNTLPAENDYLRQQVNLLSLRTGSLETEAGQLNERSDRLKLLLYSRKIAMDTVSRFSNAVQKSDMSIPGEK